MTRLPPWSSPSPGGKIGGVDGITYFGGALSTVDSMGVLLEHAGAWPGVEKVTTRFGQAGLVLEGGQLLANSIAEEHIDAGDAGHFGISLFAYGAIAMNPELWGGGVLYGIGDTALQFHEYQVKYTANGYVSGQIVTGWESVFGAPGSDNREEVIRSIMKDQNIERPAAEDAYKALQIQQERQSIQVRNRWR
jgi:hypothetical protein